MTSRRQLNLPSGVAATPDHGHVVVDSGNFRIRRVLGPMPGFGTSNIAIPSEDGIELYQFDASGRHMSTVSTRFFDAVGTPVPLYTFQYDTLGFVTQVKDRDGNVTTIARDTRGVPYEIVGPYGQKTGLELGSDGFLSRITDPLGSSDQFVYSPGGLLKDYTDRRGNVWSYQYDNVGRLVRATDPEGGDKQLAYAPLLGKNGFTVTATTKQTSTVSEVSTYQVEYLPGGAMQQTNTGTCCVLTTVDYDGVGSTKITYPSGALVQRDTLADPRFGIRSPWLSRGRRVTPGGLVQDIALNHAVTTDPTNPLRLLQEVKGESLNGKVRTRVFDAVAGMLTSTSPEGRSAFYAFSNRGSVSSLLLPTAVESLRLTYDTQGRLRDAREGTGVLERKTTYGYQAAGSDAGYVSLIVWPSGRASSYARDATGRVKVEGVGLLGGQVLTTRYSHDERGQVTGVTAPSGAMQTIASVRVPAGARTMSVCSAAHPLNLSSRIRASPNCEADDPRIGAYGRPRW